MVLEKEHLLFGHRKRLRDRFARSPLRTLSDYEILEIILFNIFARRDTKALSKTLLTRFGSLSAILSADPADLHTISGVGAKFICHMKLLQDFFSRLLLPIQLEKTHILNNWLAVLNYCQFTMGFKTKEYFRVLFLNKKNILIADELFDLGTVDKIIVYPREIAKQAILHGAFAIIMVHNHPSGDVSPSKDDIEVTKRVFNALEAVNVVLHDHVIIAKQEHFSFRSNNLI